MTMIKTAISKDSLARLDIYRRTRGLRTRKQALERLLSEVVPEHPLTTKLRLAKENPTDEALPKEVEDAILEWREGRAETTSHAEMKAILERRTRVSSP